MATLDPKHALARERDDPPGIRDTAATGGDGVPARTILPFQPEPIQAIVASFEGADGTRYTTLVRRWTATAAARCRLCRACTAKVGPDRQAVCVVVVEGEVPGGSGAVLTPDTLGLG